MKFKHDQAVVLMFKRYGRTCQHVMTAHAALCLARDMMAVQPDMEVWPIDSAGRRFTAKPITFTDLDFSN